MAYRALRQKRASSAQKAWRRPTNRSAMMRMKATTTPAAAPIPALQARVIILTVVSATASTVCWTVVVGPSEGSGVVLDDGVGTGVGVSSAAKRRTAV